ARAWGQPVLRCRRSDAGAESGFAVRLRHRAGTNRTTVRVSRMVVQKGARYAPNRTTVRSASRRVCDWAPLMHPIAQPPSRVRRVCDRCFAQGAASAANRTTLLQRVMVVRSVPGAGRRAGHESATRPTKRRWSPDRCLGYTAAGHQSATRPTKAPIPVLWRSRADAGAGRPGVLRCETVPPGRRGTMSGAPTRSCRSAALEWLPIALLALAVGAACDGRRVDGAVQAGAGGAAVAVGPAPAAPPLADSTFARLIAELSEPGGYFDTDNLISNEASFLHVAQDLRELRDRGGAYIGVGPDQNFSYIAALRPTIAFILDIRRDNMLQHLFFKALFELSPDRLTYLGLLFGREVDGAGYDEAHAGIETLVDRLDAAAVTPESRERPLRAVQGRVQALSVPLSSADLERIAFIHRSVIEAGPDIRFTSHGRRPQFYYPTYRQLLLERDRTGLYANYLASAEDFRFVRSEEHT